MSEQPPVRVAVVGLGYWGPNLLRNLAELPEAEVVMVCDLSPELLERYGARHWGLRTTTRFADVLSDPGVDAVVIATPVSTHHELGVAALRSGKHVFIEKPLAASLEKALALQTLARDRDLVLMPGHTFLYSPPVNKIRDLIHSGELGEIYFVSTSRVNLGLHQSDVSVAWDLGPHDFSILRHWFGEAPTHVSALSRGCVMPHTPDVAFVNLEYGGGMIANVELSWLAPSKLRRTTIVGSQKMVVYDDSSNEPVRVFDSGVIVPDPGSFGEYKLTYRTGDILSPHVAADEPLMLEMADFCRAVSEGGEPRSSAGVGVDVVRVIEAVDASLALSGTRIEVATLQPALQPAKSA